VGEDRSVPARLHGVAAQRSRFHLAYRLAVRSYSIMEMAKRTDDRRAVAAASAVSVSVDVGLWWVLRHTERLLLLPRLAIDAVDTAAWARRVDGPPEAATLPGVPLAMEAGIRVGPLAAIVPLAHIVVTTAARRRAGRSTSPTTFSWQVFGVVMGNLLSWYEQRERDATQSLYTREFDARLAAARLAGQNDVAMEADSVVDEVARVEYLLAAVASGLVGAGRLGHPSPSVGTGRALAAWKTSLAAATSDRAAYLATVLNRWQRARYGVDLTRDVVPVVRPGDETTIISAGQAAMLQALLDQLPLHGQVEVRVDSEESLLVPGDELRLIVDGHPLVLVADATPVIRPFDPSPLIVLSGGGWCLGMSATGHGHVPVAVTLPGALASAGLAAWSHRVLTRSGSEVAEAVLLATIGLALAQALAATPRMRRRVDHEGAQVLPLLLTINAAAALAGRYWHDLPRAARLRVGAAMAAAIGVSLVVFAEPIRWGGLALGLLEVGAMFASNNQVQVELDRDHLRLLAELTATEHEAMADALAEGQRFVVELVEATTASARVRLTDLDDQLGPGLSEEIWRRLDAAERRLAELRS
jgi:hypothetical protein